LDVAVATDVVRGIAHGCELAGCALIGGETAEMPSMYPAGEYDLAGFAVGLVEKEDIITGQTIAPGDVVLGLQSSGAHSNGYSLIRKIIDRSGVDLHHPDNKQLALDLIAPTRIYVKPLLALIKTGVVKGMAHITGGGLTENIPRVLPDGVTAVLHRDRWDAPSVFTWLQQQGNVDDAEMARTFNCGIGMVVIVSKAHAAQAQVQLEAAGERVFAIGDIRARTADEAPTIVQ
jgi:phosphoribosylformylglycinamidine cyclo-ligase